MKINCLPLKPIYYLSVKSQQKEVKKDYEPRLQTISTKCKEK